MQASAEHEPRLRDLWARGRGLMSRHLLLVVIAGALGFATITTTRAQEGRAAAPIGVWEIRHGDFGHDFVFGPDGKYRYRVFTASFGSVSTQNVEVGTFAVQGDHLILRSDSGGPPRVFRWRIGRHVTSLPGEFVLFLVNPTGGEEFFYPK